MKRLCILWILLAFGLSGAPTVMGAPTEGEMTVRQEGARIVIEGSNAAAGTALSVIVLDDEENLVFLNEAAADGGGSWRMSFQPSNWSSGEYEAVASSVAWSSPIVQRFNYLAVQVPEPPIYPDAPPANPGSERIEITAVNGDVEIRGLHPQTTIDMSTFASAFQKLEETGGTSGGKLKLVMIGEGPAAGGGIAVALTTEVLKQLADNREAGTSLVIESGGVHYELPFAMLGKAAADALDNGAKLRLAIRVVTKGSEGNVSDPGARLGEALYIGVETAPLEQGSFVPWKGGGANYATMTIPLDRKPTERNAGGYILRAGSKAYEYVPTRFIERGGRYYAVIASHSGGTFVVSENRAEWRDTASHWAGESIERLGSKRLMTGMPGGEFQPDAKMTRAQFATVLARALTLVQTADSSRVRYKDVPGAAWHASAVAAVSEVGLLQGDGGGAFRPDAPITREEAATVLYRVLEYVSKLNSDSSEKPEFGDSGVVSPWAKSAVEALTSLGVIRGLPSGDFEPQRPVSRAEAVVLLERLLAEMGWLTEDIAKEGTNA